MVKYIQLCQNGHHVEYSQPQLIMSYVCLSERGQLGENQMHVIILLQAFGLKVTAA